MLGSYPLLGLYVLVGCLGWALTQQQPACRQPVDICFIMDRSGSVTQQGWTQSLNFVSQILDSLTVSRDGALVGVIAFDTGVSLEVPPGQYTNLNSLKAAISRLRWSIDGKTSTTDALDLAARECFSSRPDRQNVINIAVFLSDGMPTENVQNLPNAIRNLHGVASVVISIGVGTDIDSNTLRDIAKSANSQQGPPVLGQDFFSTVDFDTLHTLVPNLAPRICPPVPTPTPPPTVCKQAIDVCLILDRSGSVTVNAWQMTLDFVKNIISYLQVSSDMARVGVVTFATNARLDIPLGSHFSNRDLIAAIDQIQYTEGDTNTADALTLTANQCFRSGGDRQNVINVAIFLSDGVPTLNQGRLSSSIAELHNAAEVVASIGVGTDLLTTTLIDIAKRIDGRRPPTLNEDYFITPSFANLQGLVTRLAPRVCPTVAPTLPPERICNEALDICMILDSSGSVLPQGWNTILDFITNVIGELTISNEMVRVGVVTFATQANLAIPLGSFSNNNALVNAIRGLQYTSGETNTAAALSLTANSCFNSNLDRRNVRNIVLFLSDGMPSINTENLNNGISDLHNVATLVASIGVGPEINTRTLANIAKRADNQRPPVANTDYWTTTIDTLQDLVTQISPSVCPTPPPCSSSIDLCLVLDSSASVTQAGWDSTRTFVTRVLESLTVSPDQVRVGVVTFSTTAKLDIGLGTHFSNQDLIAAIARLQYAEGESTNTADALTVTATQCFGGSSDRRDVANVVLVITDGIPTTNEQALPQAIDTLHAVTSIVASIGVGQFDSTILARISKRPGVLVARADEEYFTTTDFNTLPELVALITPRVCPSPPPITCGAAVDVCLVLDSSGSVTQSGWDMTLQFANRIVESLVIASDQARVGVIRFSTRASLNIPLGAHTNSQDLIAAINSLQFIMGETNTAQALRLAADQCFRSSGDRADADNIVIFLSDGMPTTNNDQLPGAIQNLHSVASIVASIGVGPDIAVNTLIQITKRRDNTPPVPDVDYFATPNFNTLQDLVRRITPRFCPTPPPPTQPPPPCQATLDVCLILDSSGSVTQEGWQQTLDFASKFATCFSISSVGTRLGVVTFSNTASLHIPLGRYPTSQGLIAEIQTLPFLDGWTNTAGALNAAASQCFTSANDRREVLNVAIFISDGSPTINIPGVPGSIVALHNVADIVVSVGVGREISRDTLFQISKRVDGRPSTFDEDYFVTPSYDKLTDLVERIVEISCVKPATLPTPPINICRQTADICFMLDRSGSETLRGWEDIKMTAYNLINTFTTYSEFPQIGVVTFSDHADLVVPLGTYSIPDLRSRIMAVPFANGYTNTAATLQIAATQCFSSSSDRPGIKNIGIFISDGVTTLGHQNVPQATRQLHAVANNVFALGIGVNISEASLRNVSKRQDLGTPARGRDYFVGPTSRDIITISNVIRKSICDDSPTIAPTLPPVTTPTMCTEAVDVCVVLDGSGSVKELGWALSLMFVQNMITQLMVGPNKVQLGVVTFATSAYLDIPLGSLPTASALMNGIAMLRYPNGFTNTADALEITAQQCFNPNVDRPGVRNAVIFISDGVPTLKQQEVPNAIVLLKSKADVIISVGVEGDGIEEQLLREITKSASGAPPRQGLDYFLTQDFMTLQTLVNIIVSQACPN